MEHAAASGTSKLLFMFMLFFYIYVNTLYVLHFTFKPYIFLYCLFVCAGVIVERHRPTVESVARMDLALIERSLVTVPILPQIIASLCVCLECMYRVPHGKKEEEDKKVNVYFPF